MKAPSYKPRHQYAFTFVMQIEDGRFACCHHEYSLELAEPTNRKQGEEEQPTNGKDKK
jgi:hypothetical protein